MNGVSMIELRVPSLQHLARNCNADPVKIQKDYVRLAKNPPTFSYNPLHSAVRDLLVLHVPYAQIEEGIRRGVKREAVRDRLLEVLPLIRRHFEGLAPDFVQRIERRYYPVGRGLMVPFEPPLVYGIGGQICFPWFSFWKRNPLSEEALSLFVTLVDELLLQDPDLEGARFYILDFSAPKGQEYRGLNVIDTSDIPRMSSERKIEMLGAFAEGFQMAKKELADTVRPSDGGESTDVFAYLDHPDLFK